MVRMILDCCHRCQHRWPILQWEYLFAIIGIFVNVAIDDIRLLPSLPASLAHFVARSSYCHYPPQGVAEHPVSSKLYLYYIFPFMFQSKLSLYSDFLKPSSIQPVNLSDASKYLRWHLDIFLWNPDSEIKLPFSENHSSFHFCCLKKPINWLWPEDF